MVFIPLHGQYDRTVHIAFCTTIGDIAPGLSSFVCPVINQRKRLLLPVHIDLYLNDIGFR